MYLLGGTGPPLENEPEHVMTTIMGPTTPPTSVTRASPKFDPDSLNHVAELR